MVHCLGLPLLTAVLPLASVFGGNEEVHLVMVVLAVPVTAWVVFSEFSDNRNMRFIAAACIGIGLMISTIAVPVFEPYETIITVIGGTLLAGAHLWRWFRNKSHSENENSGGASV